MMGGQTIKNRKVYNIKPIQKTQGKCEPCNTSKPSLCCKLVIDTSTFQSYQTQQLYTIFYKLKCKSKFIIYILNEMCIYAKSNMLEKLKQLLTWLNNHKKDVHNPKATPADLHFRKPGYSFNIHAKFTLMEQLSNIVIFKQHTKTP